MREDRRELHCLLATLLFSVVFFIPRVSNCEPFCTDCKHFMASPFAIKSVHFIFPNHVGWVFIPLEGLSVCIYVYVYVCIADSSPEITAIPVYRENVCYFLHICGLFSDPDCAGV